MKRILFLMASNDPESMANRDWRGVRDIMPGLLGDDCTIELATFAELAYFAAGENSRIWHPKKKWDIADFDLVVFRRVGKDLELGISAAHYLESKQVPFVDHYLLTQGKGKLAGAFMRVANDLPVPATFFGTHEVYKTVFSTKKPPLAFPMVIKADNGRKGRDNYLVQNLKDLLAIVQNNSDLAMVAQAFIPNDGDMRVLVLNGKARLVILRKGEAGSHLNNTSQGGKATLLPLNALSADMRRDCVRAAQLDRLQVAGVDIIIDSQTGKHYLLEVNRAPQLATGAFADEKLQAYSDTLAEIVNGKARVARGPHQQVIGRVEVVGLPLAGVEVPARIDTGARTSAIWASNIKLGKDGTLSFCLFGPESKYYSGERIATTQFTQTVVASSNGVSEKRFKVKLRIVLAGRTINASFTLANRSTQVYPVLIGRNVLRGKMVVDVRTGSPLHEEEQARTQALRRSLKTTLPKGDNR